jgi:hypothetical protein
MSLQAPCGPRFGHAAALPEMSMIDGVIRKP